MRHKIITLLLSSTLSLSAPVLAAPSSESPAPEEIAPVLIGADAIDIWTHAQPHVARVTHISLDLDVDFTAQNVGGKAVLDLWTAPGAQQIILDSENLAISSITDDKGRALPFAIGASDPRLGAPVTVTLNGAKRIIIHYRSAAGASALQWLPPAMTAGKSKPYLFSQGQAIHNRSWVPTQDSPGIRQTWDAKLTVPADLVAVMSAEKLSGDKGERLKDGRRRFAFKMDKAVPPYLIAFAVGDLHFQSLGPRSGVWAEAEMLQASAYEFADIEAMIDAASALYGPYRWGRYDMLVLPPAFPYGGMENPMLTFLTPTLITGDRSNTDVVAHELAHSWSGNLVTNATWSDGWLNEGFTTYFENRIMEALYGKERAALYTDLDWDDMSRVIAANGGQTGPKTRLNGTPGDGLVDYTKGSNFLRMLEVKLGRARWDAYLKSYFDRYAFQPQTTAGFLADLRQQVLQNDPALELSLQLDRWAYGAGLPDNAVHVKSSTLAAVDQQLAAFAAGGPASAVNVKGWNTQQWQRFLNGLPRQLPAARLAELDNALHLSTSNNAYARSAWLQLAINNRYDAALPSLRQFTTSVGRGLFIKPLFTGLMAQGDWGKAIAADLFREARPTYHPSVANSVEAIIAGEE
ncbi:M1 family metallopeptidase [Sphingopyxis yananensis]|uniref:M1 family metallopeptidase n=1 Tax=Sphingopyxis yananensis TaxID=2886687 RepID=UPI001D10E749|nr:M1 family metallopeptidase [Sphingopyxis yananensis]MCC2602785.1 M1 family metallopeptidase [Sphingopyxis yananensis]